MQMEVIIQEGVPVYASGLGNLAPGWMDLGPMVRK